MGGACSRGCGPYLCAAPDDSGARAEAEEGAAPHEFPPEVLAAVEARYAARPMREFSPAVQAAAPADAATRPGGAPGGKDPDESRRRAARSGIRKGVYR